jgi:NADH-quinone oxidoreductase subunit N
MNIAGLYAFSPFIVLAATSIVVMLGISFYRDHVTTNLVTLLGLAVSFLALLMVTSWIPRQITPLIIEDSYAFFYSGLILCSTFLTAMLSYDYLEKLPGNPEEYYLLLVLAAFGAVILVASSHFASFFLGIEILSISLYALIAYPLGGTRNIEAGVKYLILAGLSSAFLLFGMALVYAKTGTMEFATIASDTGIAGGPVFLAGLALIIVGAGFKLAVVPFHMWTPDVYEGAPAPVTGFIATVSKGAMFALLLRYFIAVDVVSHHSLFVAFAVISVASMFVGNLLALLQKNVKRILAYSSIAHLGYLLVAFLAGGAFRVAAVTYYLVAYFITTLGAFAVITVLSGSEREADDILDYQGLATERPWIAGVFTAMLFSLAGIPLTAGFFAKYYVLVAGVGSALWVLVVILAVNSAIGLYYYLRIIIAMYGHPGEKRHSPADGMSITGGFVLAVLTFLLLWFGVYPAPLVEFIQKTAALLG